MSRSSTRLLVRDELIGFARSKVILILWIVLPCLTVAGFLLLPDRVMGARHLLSATAFMSVLQGTVVSLVAGLMIAVDIISERNRNVYPLLVIRPIRREVIIWSKFLAVFGCVVIACIVSLSLGIVVDLARGTPPTADSLRDLGRILVQMVAVTAMATAAGALFGVVTRSMVVAVVLVFYFTQNVAVLPMLPILLGWLPDTFWWFMAISFALVGILLWISGRLFRRAQL